MVGQEMLLTLQGHELQRSERGSVMSDSPAREPWRRPGAGTLGSSDGRGGRRLSAVSVIEIRLLPRIKKAIFIIIFNELTLKALMLLSGLI